MPESSLTDLVRPLANLVKRDIPARPRPYARASKSEKCEFVLRDSLFAAALCGRAVKEPLGPLKFCRKHRAQVLESLIDYFAASQRLRAMIERRADPENFETMFDRMMIEVIERNAAREREHEERSVIYFVQRDDLVKIGITQNLDKRIKEISRGSSMIPGMTVGPVKLLASIPGGRDEERELHRRFAASRVDGEWFRLDATLQAYIEDLQASTDLTVALD